MREEVSEEKEDSRGKSREALVVSRDEMDGDEEESAEATTNKLIAAHICPSGTFRMSIHPPTANRFPFSIPQNKKLLAMLSCCDCATHSSGKIQ